MQRQSEHSVLDGRYLYHNHGRPWNDNHNRNAVLSGNHHDRRANVQYRRMCLEVDRRVLGAAVGELPQ